MKKLLEDRFKVVCVKNGYGSKVKVKGSGYRDMKMLVDVGFDNLKLQNVPKVQSETKVICEIELMCAKWLDNKKTTSLSYNVLRANNLRNLFNDFSKYVHRTSEGTNFMPKSDPTQVLKNGWVNMAKCTDFSKIDKDTFLIDAVRNGWEPAGVEILVSDLGANLEVVDDDKSTPAGIAARIGHDNVLKTLLALKANIHSKDRWNMMPIHHATMYSQENCIRILVDAGSEVNVAGYNRETALDLGRRFGSKVRIMKLLNGEKVPPLKTKSAKKMSMMDQAKTAAVEGTLTKFFDMKDVEFSMVKKLMASQGVATKLENIFQVLWFGGNIEYEDNMGYRAISYAARYGDLASIDVLIELRATVNCSDGSGWTPLHHAAKYGTDEMVKALMDAKANIHAMLRYDWTPLHIAAKYGTTGMVSMLLKAGANPKAVLNDKTLRTPAKVAQSAGNQEIVAMLNAASN